MERDLAAAVRESNYVEAQRLQLILDSLPSSSAHKDKYVWFDIYGYWRLTNVAVVVDM